MPRKTLLAASVVLFTLLSLSRAAAWDEIGHVVVTRLAAVAIPKEMPDWIKTPAVRERLEYLANEPDRWRGQHNIHLDHFNKPDHYMDEESLKPFGLTFMTLPPLRGEFNDLLAAKRAQDPSAHKTRDANKDKDYTYLTPGMLPYRIAELQWTIAASWTTLKTYEENRSLVTDAMIENARANIVFHMGILSHYVGDGAQPLHTTTHHHGWKGENPRGFTTQFNFHEFVDGDVIDLHGITPESLESRAKPPRAISQTEYWRQIGEYLTQTHELVVPLYELEKSGELKKPAGKRFIEDRLLEGGAMLAGIWKAAYESAHIDSFRVNQLKENAGKRSAHR